MPIIEIIKPNAQTKIVVWKLTESIEDLLKDTSFTPQEDERLKNSHPKRVKELLGVKACLRELKISAPVSYTEQGKPYIEDSHFHISISHSNSMISVGISPCAMGIDIEIKDNYEKILRVQDKFIREEELSFICKDKNTQTKYLQLIWSIKEALYKLSSIHYPSLRDNYRVLPFPLEENSPIDCEIISKKQCTAYYFSIENYYLVYVLSKRVENIFYICYKYHKTSAFPLKKAIIIQNKYIGDVLTSSILAKNLKKIYPDIEVDFLCYNRALGVLENNPYINKIISFNIEKIKNIFYFISLILKIRREKYDIIIDPYSKAQSKILSFFSGAKVVSNYKRSFFKARDKNSREETNANHGKVCSAIGNRCSLLTPFLKNNPIKFDYQTEIFLTEQEKQEAKKKMQAGGIAFDKPIIVLATLGSNIIEKSWPFSYMSVLINELLEKFNIDILLNYIPNQKESIDKILEGVDKDKLPRIYSNILGSSIREFAAIMDNCTALIGNEGGAVNIAKALIKPTYSIASPHVFRKEWGCYEDMEIHQSAYIEDFYPTVFPYSVRKTIRKNAGTYYKLLRPDLIIGKIELYVQNTLHIPLKEKETIKDNIVTNSYPNKISALCICYNEAHNLKAYIDDVSSFADEIIILDSFSTDNTKQIIEAQYPQVKFYERKFDNFTNQRNHCISLAKYPWITFFDLDERIPDTLKREILYTVNNPQPKEAYWIYRNFFFLNKWIKYSGWRNDKAIRLFKNGNLKYTDTKLVHEQIICDDAGIMKNRLDHYSFTSLESYKKKLDHYSTLQAKERFLKGEKVTGFKLKFKPIYRFFNQYIIQRGFLDGKEGLLISKLYYNYVKDRYIKLQALIDNKK